MVGSLLRSVNNRREKYLLLEEFTRSHYCVCFISRQKRLIVARGNCFGYSGYKTNFCAEITDMFTVYCLKTMSEKPH